MLFLDPEKDEYVIYDWKRSREIKFDNKYAQGRGPVKNLDDCNYTHYCLQLNMYKYILENYYTKTIRSMHLLVLHPNHDNYQKIDVPDMSNHIRRIIEFRKKQLSLKT
jgi:hypothetical protein